jgi:hypothetical protein
MVEKLLEKVGEIRLNGNKISSSRRDYSAKKYASNCDSGDCSSDNCDCTQSGDCVCVDCNEGGNNYSSIFQNATKI